MTAPEASTEAWKATVETLQRFYSVVVAIALTSALSKLVGLVEQPRSTAEIIQIAALTTAFLSTIVPFYHGMERHLYETHRVLPALGVGGRRFPLLADIFVFMIEGGILFAMGRQLDNAIGFLSLWSALLIVDVVWSALVWFVQKGPRPFWTLNNVTWLVLAWVAWFVLPLIAEDFGFSRAQPLVLSLTIAGLEIGRSIVDYMMNWRFYFPDNRPLVAGSEADDKSG